MALRKEAKQIEKVFREREEDEDEDDIDTEGERKVSCLFVLIISLYEFVLILAPVL